MHFSELEGYRYFTPTKVRFCETDANGHLSHLSSVIYMEQARCEYMNGLGLFFIDGAPADKTFFLVNQRVEYKSQAHFNDELLIYMKINRIGKSSVEAHYAIVQRDTQQVVSVGASTGVYIDVRTQKSTPLPEDLAGRIERFEAAFAAAANQ
ncbi:acyl-CoA thioesterase [Paenibacillus sp. GCM10023248]|uniref:acyl-CoA thioesterase n=1 Tax=Bacillales TaxID=1385 RepID=UPI00237872D7|nr:MULTISPECIES: thioesterase family protein [Bacillales]MDD9272175.1 thioesterase family protein [Paenibacillus sp. MAHUQ-63]MDR6885345.1 acyl-CoA thioester hydrolase [Bacillus sp. 3255]